MMRRDSPDSYLNKTIQNLPAMDQALFNDPAFKEMMKNALTDTARRGAGSLARDFELLAKPWPFRVEELVTPVDCWHGTADPTFPLSLIRALTERIPNCRATFLDGETHLLVHRHWHTIITNLIDPGPAE